MLCYNLIFKNVTNFTTFLTKRYAGHSKWANIRHTKAEKDSERSMLFLKLCQRIKVAIQEGGNDNPNSNVHLAQAVEVAKKQNMPVSTIQSCIKSCQTDKSKTQSVWFEIRGPRGCLFIVSALTVNPKRSRDLIASILKKNGAIFSENSGKHVFDYKGIVTAKPPQTLENPLEATVDDAIECGAEEVIPLEDVNNEFNFICAVEQMNIVKGKLQSLNYEIKAADFNFIPKLTVQLTDDEMEAMSKLVDKLEALPEIIKIYDNIE